uniref:bifunctional epoxide hydrolase 2 isoform X3 n=1 Tax=Gasterosteus aculeatus aculeatus TaxID=481459 RepID=UPI001A998E4B|nr:bifunctional epoxide hydrolase 2 isoform X3 [Gasterosteus aculeatus aculeatus]
MSEKKAVLFNFWGVVASSRPRALLQELEELHQLPGGFLSEVASRMDGAMSRAERGQVTFSQMIPAFEAECAEEAGVRGVTLPSDWSARGLLEDLREAMMDVQPAVMKTAVRLRHSGLLTAVLANHWLDDVAAGGGPARLLSLLGAHFDLVLQSCRSGHRVPEPAMFRSALQQLGVTSQQALWMDADEEGVKAAEGVGMTAVLVEDLDEALKKLANFTGVQAVGAETPPPPCSPDDVAHGYVTIRPGVRTHYVEMGSGPPVVLCHGFPESWYSWRYQIPAVAAAGFRVLALDMKGYGGSTAPPDIEEYSQQQLCKDLIIFLDKMAIPQVTLVGHDWGGVLVWTMAQYFPERVRAAASLNTPLFPADPSVSPAEKLKAIPIFDYQLYFQKPVSVLLLPSTALHLRGTSTALHLRGTSTALHLRGTSTAIHLRGTSTAIHLRGTSTALHLRGTSTALHLRGTSTALHLRGTSTALHLRGTSTALHLRGTSTALHLRGTSTALHIRGTSTALHIRGTSTALHLRGTSTALHLRGTSAALHLRGTSAALHLRGTSTALHLRGTCGGTSTAFYCTRPQSTW